MPLNNSPWIAQLKKSRIVQTLPDQTVTDTVIVGGGIAGITTAFFALKYTTHKILLLEAFKIAHGATGHNAGQIASYFERQISDIAREFGIELAADAQNAIDSTWLLLHEIYDEAKLKTPFSSFTGYAGCQDLEEINIHLENILACQNAKIKSESLIIANDHPILNQIPQKYHGLYTTLPQQQILDLLETNNHNFLAAVTGRKGCMNSALFCEELLHYLLQHYPNRFQLAEHSRMNELILEKDSATLKISDKTVTAKKVILCTNGFEKFSIINNAGPNIDKNFHHLVKGSVGYMAGYLEPKDKPPTAISYLPKHQTSTSTQETEPYIYLTRRNFEIESHQNHNLVCVGGPEALMDDTTDYHYSHPYPEEAQNTIDNFLHKSYKYAPSGEINYTYKWHGLMGYTPNGIRCIGPDAINPILLYNLGCNGVGILPSIYGAKRISQFLNGEKLKRSIFDAV